MPLYGKPTALPGLARRRRARAAAPPRRGGAGERRRCSAGRRLGSTRATAPCGSRSTACSGSAAPASCDALGIEPAVVHLNEGHPALAALEFAAARSSRACRATRRSSGSGSASSSRPTHRSPPGTRPTRADEFLPAFGDLRTRLGIERGGVPRPLPRRPRRGGAARHDAARDPHQPAPQRRQPAARRGRRARCGVRSSRATSSRRSRTSRTAHTSRPSSASRSARCSTSTSATPGSAARRPARRGSECARSRTTSPVGRPLRGARPARRVPPDEEPTQDSLLRGEQLDYVRAVESSLDPDSLTIGFARRLATYKRFHLLNHDPDRARRIFSGAHPVAARDRRQGAPERRAGARTPSSASTSFEHGDAELAGRVAIVEDYDIGIARHLVSGCDVWLNLPRKPMEASGTSGMKATFNGCAPAQRARRLVGRGLRRHERLGDSRRRRRGSRRRRRRRRGRSSTTCSSTR